MIKVLKIVSPDFTYAELKEFARRSSEGSPCKRILLPTVDAVNGKQVEILFLLGHENDENVELETC